MALVVWSLPTVPGARAAVRGFKARIPVLLTLACLLVAAPATAQLTYGAAGGHAFVSGNPDASGDVVIDSTYLGYPVTFIVSSAFAGCTGLTSVTIPNSVTGIGPRAFSGCSSLTNVILGNGLTSIGALAFSGCTNLTSVSIPNSVTSIGNSAFSGCTSLTSVTIGNSVTSIGVLPFDGCTSLTNLSVDAANPACSSLNGVLFNKAQTTLMIFPPGRGSYVIPDSVISIGGAAFYRCTALRSVTIPDSVTQIGTTLYAGGEGARLPTAPA